MSVKTRFESFGARDILVCPKCGERMGLTRRTPHSVFGMLFERQTFTCYSCHFETERSSDKRGDPHN